VRENGFDIAGFMASIGIVRYAVISIASVQDVRQAKHKNTQNGAQGKPGG
jgi:hypothetical protein